MSAATSTTSRPAPSRGPLTELLMGGGAVRRAAWIFVGLMLLVSVVRIVSGEQALNQILLVGHTDQPLRTMTLPME